MSLKIVFLLAFLTVVFGLPSPPKKQPIEISKETLRGLPLSALKKPLINKPNQNLQLLGKPVNDPSEGLNDEISKEGLGGLPSSVLKKPKKNQKNLGKQTNYASEGLNDEINQADEIDEKINNDEILVESVPSRMKRATCRYATFRTKSGKTLIVYRCTK